MTRLTALFLGCVSLVAQAPGSIQTFAGTGSASFSGDGGPANRATLNVAVDVSADRAGNVFIADQFNHRIRRVALDGAISTVAGTGAPGFSGDGGPAVNAQINTPTGICADANGNLYIADVGNNRIRKVDASGVITTLAGNGSRGFGGDGGPAIAASFFNAVRVAVDPSGNVLIADQSNHRIRRVTPEGTITTIAGNGAGTPANGAFSGDGGPASGASLNNPTALTVDATGIIYFSDQFNHRIRKIAGYLTITTIAGNGSPGFTGDGGPATAASVNFPGGISLDVRGNLYFNDDINYRVRRIATGGTITTIAGSGARGFSGDGGTATAASLNGNFGITLDLFGNLYIADSTNNRIRVVYAAVPGLAPVISAAGVTNAASFASGASPGALTTIFGTNLTRNLNGIVQNSGVPLPSSLAGTTVTVGGRTAPIFNVVNINGQEQISVQLPVDAVPGPAIPVVLNNGFATATVPLNLTAVQPGIFTIDGSQAAALHADFSLVSGAQPASSGETIIVFCTGLGVVNPSVATGAAASATILSTTVAAYTATIAGQNATVVFSGLAPGFVALGQVNLVVPPGTPPGVQDLVLRSGGSTSNVAKIQVR
ncbi:MAG: hypothetical protein ACKV2U_02210 [Bryobacteraceae bacterium]